MQTKKTENRRIENGERIEYPLISQINTERENRKSITGNRDRNKFEILNVNFKF
ncbi:MAG: hypothetical protein L0Y76_00815 [Ignavibacteria bacterium]|nr:hypothetical protein [Ignavibacteria bacterium]